MRSCELSGDIRMKNGHRITIAALVEQAEQQAFSDKSNEFDRTMLLLLIAIVNRQNEIYDSVDDIRTTPAVVASEFIANNKTLAVLLMSFVILLIGILAHIPFSDIIALFQVVPVP